VSLGGPVTVVALGGGRTAGELVVDAAGATGLASVTLCAGDGRGAVVDLSALAGVVGELRLSWDVGIVEAFRGGLAGTWTDLRVASVAELRLHGPADLHGTAHVWRLARAGRR